MCVHRIVLISLMICLPVLSSSCKRLSLSMFPTQTPTTPPSVTPTPEECSWSGEARAWNDSNANGIREITESPLANVRFFTEDRSHNREKTDWGITGTGGSMGLILLLPGCPELEFEVYSEVPENCRLTTPARILADTRKKHEEFSFGFLCR